MELFFHKITDNTTDIPVYTYEIVCDEIKDIATMQLREAAAFLMSEFNINASLPEWFQDKCFCVSTELPSQIERIDMYFTTRIKTLS